MTGTATQEIRATKHGSGGDDRITIVNRTRGMRLGHAIEIAGTGSTRRKGLLGRDSLGHGEGLWIVPCEAIHTIGMRFPIDVVYLDRDLRVVKVKHNVGPWRLSGSLRAHSVLELPTGVLQDTGTLVGDVLVREDSVHASVDGEYPILGRDGVDGTVMQRRKTPPAQALLPFLVVSIATIAFCLTVTGIVISVLGKNAAGTHDFVEYWATAKLLASGGNPYDADSLHKIELSVGFPTGIPALVPWTLPHTQPLFLPLGLFSATAANLIWFGVLLAALFYSVKVLSEIYPHASTMFFTLGCTFAPVLGTLLAGQVSVLVLLGLVLFLRWHRTAPFLAGVSLWLCLLKPQLFVPFGVVLCLWIFRSRSYRLLAGAVTALGSTAAIVTVLDPRVWAQYHTMTRSQLLPEGLPCPSLMLSRALSPDALWISYAPASIAAIWAVSYFLKNEEHWDWVQNGSLLLLVSVAVAPYFWFFDEALLLPAILWGARDRTWTSSTAILVLSSAALELAVLGGASMMRSTFLLGTTPFYLVWYLYATRERPAMLRLAECGSHS